MVLFQFLINSPRASKEMTLKVYEELQRDVFSEINKKINNDPDIVLRVSREPKNGHSDTWEELTNYLVRLECFSAGVNMKLYSLSVLNQLGGAYFVRIYEKLEPLISRKERDNESNGNRYEQYKETVRRLRKMQRGNQWPCL